MNNTVIPKLIAKLQHGRMDECAEELAETIVILMAVIDDLHEELQELKSIIAVDPEDIH
jgi:hypothetical protein